MRSSRPGVVVSLIYVLFALPAAAQTVQGTFTDAETGEPLEGAAVALVNEAGDRVTGTLSRGDGRFLVLAPVAGRYRLEGRLIGYETAETPFFTVVPGEAIERRLIARVRAVALDGLTAEVKPRCEAKRDATGATQRLWDEARAALEAVSLTHDADAIRFEARRWVRDVERESGRVTAETVEPIKAFRRHPFRSNPVAELLKHGFVREVGDSTAYYGPDAHVLLSDPFLETHCFWAVERGDRWVGLAFEPVPGRGDVPEIEGTLWIERETAELRSLTFRYVNVAWAAKRAGAGGHLVFERLANGAYVVNRWQIRMPRLAITSGRGGVWAVGMREAGGELVAIRGLGTGRVFQEPPGVIEGRIVSEAGVPIAGALVFLSGTQHADSTDADGSFRFPNVREGRYELAWFHEELTPMVGADLRDVQAVANKATTATVTVSGVDRWLAGGCAATQRRPGTGVVFGTVRDAETGVPLGGSAVRLIPTHDDLSNGAGAASRARPKALETLADRSGEFRFCAVPPGDHSLEASLADRMAGPLRVSVADGARLERTLSLEPTTIARADAARASARIAGRVVDGIGGGPVAAAAVRVGDSGRVRLTDERGRFLLDDVPPGTQSVRVTHAAFEPLETAVIAEAGALVQVEVILGPIDLEPLDVIATRRGRLADVYWRMARGVGGGFITAEELERRSASRTTDLLQGRVDVNVSGTGIGGSGALEFRRAGNQNCAPRVLLDGSRIGGGADRAAGMSAYEAVNTVPASAIDVIEIYRGPARMPGEFASSSGSCGVIAIWTKRHDGS